jgi:ABC-type transporter Mla subunit MlaD
MSYQLEQISKQKNKAFAVLIKTRKQLAEVVEQAQEFLSKNRDAIAEKRQEVDDLEEINNALLQQMASVEKSIDETDRILNPAPLQ